MTRDSETGGMSARADSSAEADHKSSWQPPTADDWSGMLRSATLARDLLRWSDAELRAGGIGNDDATVQHLFDVFDAAMDELGQAEDVLMEAQRRLLEVAVETKPG